MYHAREHELAAVDVDRREYLRLLRAAVGQDVPVHAAGGVANRMTAEELKAFTDAVADDGTVTGWSLYDFATTTAAGWKALAPLGGTRP